MDASFQDQITSILSDPEQMKQISSLAQSLMGEGDDTSTASAAPNAGILSNVASVLKQESKSSSEALLLAMKPYMRPERQNKVDRAIRITRVLHVAGKALGEYGAVLDGI